MREIDSAAIYYKKSILLNPGNPCDTALYVLLVLRDSLGLRQALMLNDSLFSGEFGIGLHFLSSRLPLTDSLVQSFPFYKSINDRVKSQKGKSTIVAITLSILIPGLGKLYLGQPRQALGAMALNGIWGLVLAESIILRAHPILIGMNLGIAASYYFGNIIGTSVLSKKTRVDFYKQIHEDISNHYFSKLYP